MSTFVFIHGGWHRGWHWNLVAAQLRMRGHATIAMDLPAEDPDAGNEEYLETVLDAMVSIKGDVIVVAHSIGGLTAPLVAERVQVKQLVFLSAFIPTPGAAFFDSIDPEGPGVFAEGWPELQKKQIPGPGGSSEWTSEGAIEAFYEDCDPDTAVEAAHHLRPQYWRVLNEPCPMEAWPDVECVSIIGSWDKVVDPEWSRRTARAVFGSEAIELPCGHSAMLSHPGELALVLDTYS